MEKKIIELISQSLRILNEEWQNPKLENVDGKTRIYGAEGSIDSLGLVMLIADLEDRLVAEYGKEIVLADEKAMSQKNSPFRTVESLGSYIAQLIGEEARIV